MAAVMRDHGNSYRVREEVLQCAKGILRYPQYRSELMGFGFLELLFVAIREAPRDPQVVALALESTRLFTESNSSARAWAVQNGGVELALNALQEPGGS